MNEETANNMNSKHLFIIKCEPSKDEFRLLGRPCELSAFSYVPPNRLQEPAHRSIYNTKSSKDNSLNEKECGFDNRVHRDDRRHAKQRGLDLWNEEIRKSSPSRSSQEYGRHLVFAEGSRVFYKPNYLDSPDRKYARIAKVKSEFYNRNGINDLNASLRDL